MITVRRTGRHEGKSGRICHSGICSPDIIQEFKAVWEEIIYVRHIGTAVLGGKNMAIGALPQSPDLCRRGGGKRPDEVSGIAVILQNLVSAIACHQ